MRINHNIAALNTLRQLSANNINTSSSLAKLSSGLRINSAADDAAGLAISEKMRAQISGLDQASSNANDGISLLQTAEGALSETHSILQRMRELAVQASNDTNTTADREEIQKEIDELTAEVTRISSDTEFNTKKLLDGSAGLKTTMTLEQVNGADVNWMSIVGGSGDTSTGTVAITEATAATNATTGVLTITGAGADTRNFVINGYTITYTVAGTTAADNATAMAAAINLVSDKIGVTATDNGAAGLTLTSTGAVGSADTITYSGGANTFLVAATPTTTVAGTDATVTGADLTGNYIASGNSIKVVQGVYAGLELKLNGAVMSATAAQNDATFTIDANNSLTLHIGANQGQNTSISMNKMDAETLGIDNIDISTQEGAEAAITTIDEAITIVSSERAKLGAMQNRLEHTINNLGTSSENLTAAESQIRDVDMAKEMTEFTKNNILSQAAQSMLAQANQQPQSILQLLQ